MGWVNEQIKQRKLSDQEVFEDSFMQVASVVLGNRKTNKLQDEMVLSKQAMDDILKYYHIKPVEGKEESDDFDEQLEYILRPHGIMRRTIKLSEGWYQDAYGPILGFLKDSDTPIALLPRKLIGYYYIDPSTGETITLNRERAKNISEEGYCFYRPLPLKSLDIKDLILYMKDCISVEDILWMSISTIVVSLVGLIMPRLTKVLTGPVLNSKSLGLLASIGFFMVAVTVASALFHASHSLINTRVSSKTSLAVEAAVMSRVLSLPARFFRQFSSGELYSRANSINSLCSMLFGFVFSLGLSSLSSLLYIGQIFTFTPTLVIPAIIITILTLAVSTATSLLQIRISKEQMELAAKGSGLSYGLITGMQKIKLAGAEKRAFSKWLSHYAKEAEYLYNPPLLIKISGVITVAISLIGNIILYYLAVQSNVGQSNYFAFNVSYGMMMGMFSSLVSMGLSLARVRPILDMAEPILKEEPEVAENREIVTNVQGNIELNNVSFRYEENRPLIIDNLTLKIHSGEYVAIVGKTGCGKSTLLRLLLGFEKPQSGAIYYDGKDMNTMDLKSLRRKIGTVMQDGSLFQGNIFENIAIAAPQLTLEGAWEAAEMAGIADDIRRMPMGMQTFITEGQGGVSGGQKQRLMIARAIAPKPKILMFDEATSALDNITQKHISEALDQLDCTRIIIAHRLSTIKHCDRILVLGNGKIVEEGTYEELLEKNGYFAELVKRQRLDIED